MCVSGGGVVLSVRGKLVLIHIQHKASNAIHNITHAVPPNQRNRNKLKHKQNVPQSLCGLYIFLKDYAGSIFLKATIQKHFTGWEIDNAAFTYVQHKKS